MTAWNPVATRWLLAGEWRTQPLRLAMSVLAIAVGVALGFAVHLVNGAALDYMRRQNLAGWAVEALEGAPDKRFADEAAWLAHLDQLGLARAV